MKNLKRITSLALLFCIITLFHLSSTAQGLRKICGTTVDPELYRQDAERAKNQDNPFNNLRSTLTLPIPVLQIPVSMFFVGKSDSTGHKDVEDYFNVMCETNKEYNKMGINFYLHKFSTSKKLAIDYTLNYDSLYNGLAGGTQYQRITSWAFFNNKRFNENTLNLYRTNVIDANAPGGIILGRSTFPGQGFFVPGIGEFQGGIELADDDYTTWIHEIGHFFNLYHPFQSFPAEKVFRCKKVVSMEKVVIKSSGGPVISFDIKDAVCTNQKGSITVTVTGGNTPYDYSWSSGATTASLTNLNGGTYYLTVTDNGGCMATEVAMVNNITGPSVTITTTGTTCNLNNGKAISTVTGGDGNYTYKWSDGSTTDMITNLPQGIYNLTVTDGNLCKTIGMANVLSNINVPKVSISPKDATCNLNNGMATANVNGGAIPYKYNWSNAGNAAVNSNIGKGTFYLTVTDDKGCTANDSVIIKNISGPSSLTFSVTSTSCGNQNGSLNVNVTGGTSPYLYSWSNSGTTSAISGLAPGKYKLTVTDANSCSMNDSSTIDSIVPPVVSLVSTSSSCGQNDGSSTATVVNGTQPFSFSWSNGATTSTANNLSVGSYIVMATDSNGCTDSDTTLITNIDGPSVSVTFTSATCDSADGTATANVTGGTSPYSYIWSDGDSTSVAGDLSLGDYQVTVSDTKGCTASGNVTIDNAGSPQILLSSTPENCGKSDGALNVFVSGGLAPYRYTWNTGDSTANVSNISAGNYSITVSDSLNCKRIGSTTVSSFGKPTLTLSVTNETCGMGNGTVSSSVSGGSSPYIYSWSNGSDTSVVINLGSGIYTLSVTDNNGCVITDSIKVMSGKGPSISFTTTNAACNNNKGSINVTIAGGTSPYIYSWSTGDSTSTLDSIAGGLYHLTVTDVNNCVSMDSVMINSDTMSISFAVTHATCSNNNGKIITTVTGGTPAYKYSWSNAKVTGTITSLPAGLYKLTVTDDKNCTLTDSVMVNFYYKPADSTIIDSIFGSTCGNSNGSIKVVFKKGSSPFTYSWSNGSVDSSLMNLIAGKYTLTITDNNNCTFQKTYTVVNQNGPTLTFTSNKATCGNSNGNAKGNTNGGTAPFSFLWNTGADTSYVGGLSSGYYVLKVTDKNNCVVSDTVFVDMLMPKVTFVKTDATCENSNGSSKATASQGTTPYSYLWNTGENTSQLSNVKDGIYTITVTDSKGCVVTGSSTINTFGVPMLRTWSRDASCGKSDGAAFVAISGGKIPFTYAWNNGRIKDSIMNVPAGNYTISVTDSKGCKATGIAVVNNFNSPNVSFVSTNAQCGNNDGSATAIVSGGNPPYSYSWNNSAITSSISGLSAGSYYVTVKDNNGCVATQTAIYYSSYSPIDSIACDTLMAVCGSSSVNIYKGNCETNGDLLCDTPADMDLTGLVGNYPGCQYTGSAVDTMCLEYKPDVHNWMDYVFDGFGASNYKCLGHFSKGQIGRMYSSLLAHPTVNISRSYLWANNPVPEKPDTVLPPVLIFPTDTTLLNTSAPMTFKWNASKNGEGYVIKIFENDVEKEKRFTSDTVIKIKRNFFNSSKWGFAVRPVHRNNFCNTTYSEKKYFYIKEIGDDVDETIFTPELSIFPNPVEKGESITISLSMINSLKTNLDVYDICGKKIESLEIPQSNYSFKVFEIDPHHFSRGIYMLKFTNGKKVINSKLVVY